MVLLCVVAGAGTSARAAPEIRVKVINGKLCAKCTLSGEEKSIPANIVIDPGMRVSLLVHERTAKLLRAEPNTSMTVRFENMTLGDLRPRAAKLRSLEELTNEYATDLDEIPAVAILGLPAFANFTVELDVGAGAIRLLPPAEPVKPTSAEPAADRVPTTGAADVTSWSGTYTEQAYGYWLAGSAPDGFALRVQFAASHADTIIDANVADLAGSPGGALDELYVGRLNIARYVAFRPEDLSGMPEPRPDLILGTNLLSHFRVVLDPVNRGIRFQQTRSPRFPAEERTFFVARSKGDADAIEAFLRANPSSRLAGDASEKLLSLRMEEYPLRREAVMRAVRLQAEAAQKDRRAGVMLALADALLNKEGGDDQLVADVVNVGLEYAPVALNGRTAHDLRARLGLLALRRGDLTDARRQLLSAAFGVPRDPLVNLWLGQLYERSGKPVRAWSRFAQAAISDNPPADALRGLDRLNRDPEFRKTFTMADAKELLEGRVPEFHPADQYAAASGADGRHVRLVEFFTCADHPTTQGPQMAFDGLCEYFAATDMALVQYHLAAPATDPLVSEAGVRRAAFYAIQAAPVALFDGGRPNAADGLERDAEKIYASFREACLTPADAPSPWRVEGQVSLAGNEIRAAIQAEGPTATEDVRLHVLLCERLVLAPGANGMILHRHVARAMLSPAAGLRIDAAAGLRRFSLSANTAKVTAALEQSLAALEKDRGVSFLIRPTYLDGAACDLVAFVQDYASRRILAASVLAVGGGPPSTARALP